MVSLKQAKQVKDKIVETLHPEAIILFGSVARQGQGKDFDLLTIVDDGHYKSKPNIELLMYKELKFFYKKFSIDHFIISKSTFDEHYTQGSSFLHKIFLEGRCLYMKKDNSDWIQDAEDELKMAQYLLEGDYFKGSCYHAQQSVEKYIKAKLLIKGWELEKTHNIKRLLAIAEDYKINIKLSDQEIVFIDSIYRGRYPAEVGLLPFGEPDKKDAQKAIEIVKKIIGKELK